MGNEQQEINFYQFVKELIRTILKYKWVILICLPLCIGGSYFMHKRVKFVYSNYAMIYSSYIETEMTSYLVVGLVNHMERGNVSQLAKELNVDVDVAKTLVKLTAEPAKESKVVAIGIKTLNLKYIDELQEGILYYLNNHPSTLNISELRNKRYSNSKKYMEEQIAQLNSIDWTNAENAGQLLKNKSDLIDKIESYTMTLALAETPYSYLTRFSEGNKNPEGPKLRNYIVMGAFLGVIFSAVVIFFFELKNH